MKRHIRRAAVLSFLLPGMLATAAGAQQTPGGDKQVISANPFGLLLELFNAEYERIIGESSTAGVGGSMFNSDDAEDYINADVFYRFYPQGRPLEGWAFGGKIGLTNVLDSGTYFGFGFDLNHSWLLGKRNNFYVGVGFGLKRLVGVDESEFDLEYIPTIRVVNIGFAF